MNLNHIAANIAAAKTSDDTSAGAPVHLWSPPFCGDIPLAIQFDGTWTYQGSAIGRHKLVALFASVLDREGDKYYLVTPAEKVGIQVDDVPFIVTQWHQTEQGIQVALQSGETFVIGQSHPVECRIPPNKQGDAVPYVKVRGNLWARFHQNVFYQMVDSAKLIEQNDESIAVMSSGGYTFELGRF